MFDQAVEWIRKSKKIVVFTGAGISTKSGILDFRSENGLYNLLRQKYDLPYPEAVFDIDYFMKNPKPFFSIAKNMLEQDVKPTKCHHFLSWLEEKNQIALVATQNIDMLHHSAGSKKVLECHGSFMTAHCLSCHAAFRLNDYKQRVLDGLIPYCECGGVIKPDITFFGENLPQSFYRLMNDPPEADLILILGTSLNVQPVAGFAVEMAEKVPSILVNIQPTPYDNRLTLVYHEDLEAFADDAYHQLR
jgi:NAD-dependent SIR2 family protein deacetylase